MDQYLLRARRQVFHSPVFFSAKLRGEAESSLGFWKNRD